MKAFLTIGMLACCLSAPAWAQQTEPDPAVKTGNGKTAPAKKAAKSPCSNMQGGVDASGGESVEQHSKAGKTGGNGAACGKSNGKANSPQAAPTTANPEMKDPVLK